MKKRKILFIIAFLIASTIFVCPTIVYSVDKQYYIGLNISRDGFIVKNETEDGKNSEGFLTEDLAFSPTVGFRSQPNVFFEVLGWDYILSISSIRLNQQEVVRITRKNESDSGAHDLGTNLEGYNATFAFQLMFIPPFYSDKDMSFFGAGYGASYLNYIGSVYLTDGSGISGQCTNSKTIEDVKTFCEKHSFNFSGFAHGSNITIGLRFYDIAIYLEESNPIVSKDNTEYSTRTVSLKFVYLF